MADDIFRLALAVLAVWRITHLLAREDGPWDTFRTLRGRTAGGLLGRLLACFYCLSVWVALPFALFVGTTPIEQFVAWWAISGGAILLERATAEPLAIPIEGGGDELLRTERRPADDQPG